jgi:hypothetical protein
MLYSSVAGTQLYRRHEQEGTLLPEAELSCADAHGQYRFNYRHPLIKDGREGGYLLDAFRRDFAVHGPSLLRLIRVLLNGWQAHKNDPRRIRARVAWEVFPVRSTYAGAVWAMRKWYDTGAGNDPRLAAKADNLLRDIYAEFGWRTRFITPLIGRYAFFALQREEARLAAGWTYEPKTFYEKNAAARALDRAQEKVRRRESVTIRPVPSEPAPAFMK